MRHQSTSRERNTTQLLLLYRYCFTVTATSGVDNEEKVEEFFTDERNSFTALGAVVFDEESFDGDEVRRDATVKYKIRLRAEQYEGTYNPTEAGRRIGSTTKWFTNYMFPRRASIGPRGDMYGDPEPGRDDGRRKLTHHFIDFCIIKIGLCLSKL